jgi:hypothetical protein
MENLDSKPAWLRAKTKGAVGVDREAGVIRGVILAEEGPFKDERGEFDRASIRAAVKLAQEKKAGLRARFAHPSLSADGIGKYLGRHKNVRSDTVLREVGKDKDGKPLLKEKLVARGDLHFDKTALEEPPGGGKPLGVYLMDLAESDPDAVGLSLVLKADQTLRMDERKRPLTDDKGNQLPPLWTPTELHACDAVDDGDATHSFLSADLLANLPDALVRQGCELLDAQFAGKDRAFVSAHLSAFTERYLNHKFGEPEETEAAPIEDSQPADEATALLLQIALEE